MNPIRRAFIMAVLVNNGELQRKDVAEAFGISYRMVSHDLKEFQELHGKLDIKGGPTRPGVRGHRGLRYVLPKGYDTRVPLDHVVSILYEIETALEDLMGRR